MIDQNGQKVRSQLSSDKSKDEAQRLLKKARELMDEAAVAESKLRDSQKKSIAQKNDRIDSIIHEFLCLPYAHADNHNNGTDHVNDNDNDNDNENNNDNDNDNDSTDITDLALLSMTTTLLRRLKLSPSTSLNLIERLIQREITAREAVTVTDNSTGATPGFQIADLSNAKDYRQLESTRLEGWADRIIQAQAKLDITNKDATNINNHNLATTLKVRARELRRIHAEDPRRRTTPSQPTPTPDTSLDKFVRRTLSPRDPNSPLPTDVTVKIDGRPVTGSPLAIKNLVDDLTGIPLWVPSYLLPFLIASRGLAPNTDGDTGEITREEFRQIKTDVLSGSGFRCDGWDSVRVAAVYRGDFVRDTTRAGVVDAMGGRRMMTSPTLKDGDGSKRSAEVFQEVQGRLARSGLEGKVQLFLMEDSEWRPGGMGVGSRPQESLDGPPPVIVAVSKRMVPEQGKERGLGVKVVTGLSAVSTIFTILAYSISAFSLNPTFFHALVDNNDLSVLTSCLPIAIGVIGLSLLHEIIHAITAQQTGIKLGLPVPLPSIQIGTFGSITPLRSFPESRSNLFDLAIAAPLITAAVSIAMIVLGMSLTINSSAEVIPTLAMIPVAVLKSSFLVGSIVSAIAPKIMTLPLSQPIPIHPLVLIGLAGLLSSAINLLPLGRLDGGRASSAIFGRRSAYLLSLLTLTFLAVLALTGSSTVSIFWGLIVTLFQRDAEIPVRDGVSGVDEGRFGVYVGSLVLVGLVLAPFPGGAGML